MPSFRLKHGTHSQNGKRYNWRDPEANVVESNENLAALMPEKFERVDRYENYPYEVAQPAVDSPQPNKMSSQPATMPALTPTTSKAVDPSKRSLDERYGGLDPMTEAELREVADAEGIDIPKGLKKKEDIIKFLRAGQTPAK